MSLSDPIGDMIARVKNAQARNHKKVALPSSNFKKKIADILKNEGLRKRAMSLSSKRRQRRTFLCDNERERWEEFEQVLWDIFVCQILSSKEGKMWTYLDMCDAVTK